MDIKINEELRSFIDPLTANEYAALERSLLAEGCRDALVLWQDVLVDGHNRFEICRKHGIEFKTIQNTRFGSFDEVRLWIIDNHLARRSVSDFQRGLLALKKQELTAASEAPALAKRTEVAQAARVSSATIQNIEKIQKSAAPQLVEAVRAGTISINAAANVAALPTEQQVAAVAGGRKELQQAAKVVREQRIAQRVPRRIKVEDDEPAMAAPWDETDQASVPINDLASMRERLRQVEAENAILRAELAALREKLKPV